jgi:hypothetical protein
VGNRHRQEGLREERLITTKKTDQDRLHYGAYCFACFMVALFGIGWAMKLGHG